VRNIVGKDYNVEIIVDTPLEVCKRWDLKDLDAKDCSGEIKGPPASMTPTRTLSRGDSIGYGKVFS
jgi:hypothetical protein